MGFDKANYSGGEEDRPPDQPTLEQQTQSRDYFREQLDELFVREVHAIETPRGGTAEYPSHFLELHFEVHDATDRQMLVKVQRVFDSQDSSVLCELVDVTWMGDQCEVANVTYILPDQEADGSEGVVRKRDPADVQQGIEYAITQIEQGFPDELQDGESLSEEEKLLFRQLHTDQAVTVEDYKWVFVMLETFPTRTISYEEYASIYSFGWTDEQD